MSYGITLSQDATATLTSGTPQSVTLSAPGENALDTFTLTSEESVTVNVSSIVSTPANTTVTATVYNASGTSVGSGSGTTSFTISLPNLAAGTYKVLTVPEFGATATMQVTLN
jgi:hypothetical protein